MTTVTRNETGTNQTARNADGTLTSREELIPNSNSSELNAVINRLNEIDGRGSSASVKYATAYIPTREDDAIVALVEYTATWWRNNRQLLSAEQIAGAKTAISSILDSDQSNVDQIRERNRLHRDGTLNADGTFKKSVPVV